MRRLKPSWFDSRGEISHNFIRQLNLLRTQHSAHLPILSAFTLPGLDSDEQEVDGSSIWQYSTIHKSACKIIEEQTLWGQTICRVWLPNQDGVVQIPRSALQPLNANLNPDIETHRIGYVAAAAKVAEVLEGGAIVSDGPVLLAPMESNVIPLPHQIHALSQLSPVIGFDIC